MQVYPKPANQISFQFISFLFLTVQFVYLHHVTSSMYITLTSPCRQFLDQRTHLGERDRTTIAGIVDGLELPADVAYHCWERANNASDVIKLEELTSQRFKKGDIAETAREFYLLDCQGLLDTVYFLFKARYESLNDLKKRSIMIITNRLLKDGIALNLMEIILHFAKVLDEHERPPEKRQIAQRFIVDVAKCLFFMFYETKILVPETEKLLECLEKTSDLLGNFHGKVSQSWQQPVLATLIILQITQTRALTRVIDGMEFDREVNMPPYYKEEDSNLLNQSHIKDKFMKKAWSCRLARGYSCLVYALFMQIAVEDGEPFESLSFYLQEASKLRSFSYVRTCMIPFLQNDYCDEKFRELLMASLSDFLFLVSRLFTLNNEGQFISGDGKHELPPFLISRTRFEEEESWKITQAEDDKAGSIPLGMVDCFDDVIQMYAVMGSAYPAFASLFWDETFTRHVPFTNKAVKDKIAVDSSLFVPILRFLTGIAGGGRNIPAAKATFNYVHKYVCLGDSRGQLGGWQVIFKIIDDISRELGSVIVSAQNPLFYGGRSSAQNDPAEIAETAALNNAYLVAVMELICCTVQDPESAERLYSINPIDKLFALLLTPVEADLKGAIFHAMAAIAKQVGERVVEEIWQYFERYQLLPTTNNSVGSDLRQNLNFVEAKVGRYATTDGFLALVDALLQYGNPDSLGKGHRRPGILVYLEYIVQEVISKAPGRYYAPDENGDAQRWQLQARGYQCLRTVLRNYPIHIIHSPVAVNQNTSHGSSLSSFSLPSSQSSSSVLIMGLPATLPTGDILDERSVPRMLKEMIFHDFDEQSELQVMYDIYNNKTGVYEQISAARPKTAGFAVMTWLLSGDSLFESIFETLIDSSEDSDGSMNRIEDTQTTIGKILAVLSGTKCTTAQAVHGHHNNHQNIQWANQRRKKSEIGRDLHLKCWNDLDPSYWRQTAISAAIGLLYECSVREESFSDLVDKSNTLCAAGSGAVRLLTLMPSDDSKLKKPVQLKPLSELLLSQRSSTKSPISLIAQYVKCRTTTDIGRVLSVSSCFLIKHVASGRHAKEFAAALAVDDDGLTRLRDGCVFSLGECGYSNVHGDMLIVPQGADSMFDVSKEAKKRLLTIRDAVLQLIISTLFPTSIGLAHFLLGFEQGIYDRALNQRSSAMSDPLQLMHDLPNLALDMPQNCLDIIIKLLSPIQQEYDFLSLVHTCPLQAKTCFEVLYRICAAPNTSAVALALLRKCPAGTHTNFFGRQLRNCLSRLEILSARETGDIDRSLVDDVILQQQEEMRRNELADVQQCTAWLLKICSIELHVLNATKDRHVDKKIAILNLFRNAVEDGYNFHVGGDIDYATSPILGVLEVIRFSATISSTARISSMGPVQRECLRTAVVPFEMCVGSSMYNSGCTEPINANGYFQIDPDRLERVLSNSNLAMSHDEADECLYVAATYNALQQLGASGYHLAQAVRQIISIAMLTSMNVFFNELLDVPAEYLSSESLSIAEESLRDLVDTLLLPLIRIFSIHSLADMDIFEHIAMSILPIINVVNKASRIALLSVEQYSEILNGLLKALLRNNSGGGQRRSQNSTEYYRGCISACLAHMLRYGTKGPRAEDYKIQSVLLLEPLATSLAHTLGVDISNPKMPETEIWSLSATSLLSLVLSTLGPSHKRTSSSRRVKDFETHSTTQMNEDDDFRSMYGSHAFVQILQILSSKNYLRYLIGAMTYTGNHSESDAVTFQTNMGLFSNVAVHSDGVHLLLDGGIAEKILEIGQFGIASNSYTSGAGGMTDSGYGGVIDESLLAVLGLLKTMAATYPSRRVITLCTTFVHNNYAVLSRTMSDKPSSLGSLTLTESVVGLLSIIATSDVNLWLDDSKSGSRDGGLGKYSVTIHQDTMRLLSSISTSLFYGHYHVGLLQKRVDARARDNTWWSDVGPSSILEQVQQDTELTSKPLLVNLLGFSISKWSSFDNRRLEIGLRCLMYTSLTLRIRAADSLGLEALGIASSIDFSAVLNAFSSCAEMLLALEEQRMRSGVDDTNVNVSTDLYGNQPTDVAAQQHALTMVPTVTQTNWGDAKGIADRVYYLLEDDFIEHALRFTVENLICVVHYVISAYGFSDISNRMTEIELFLRITEQFKQGSFVFNTSAWIREKVSNVKRM